MPSRSRVERDGLVEVLDGHADVIDPPEHGRGGLARARRSGLGGRRSRARARLAAARERLGSAAPSRPGSAATRRSMSSRSSTSFSSSVKANASSSVRFSATSFMRAPVREVGRGTAAPRRPCGACGRTSSSRRPAAACDVSSVPMPYCVTIERLISWTLRRSSDGAGGDLAEDDVLGHPAAEQHDQVVEQLVPGLQVAVLLGQVERVAERLAARDDRDAVHLLHRGQQLRAERVAGLVVGDHPLLVLGDHPARLHAGDHPLERGLEVAA